jgi:small-conductance mechanosensitive channel
MRFLPYVHHTIEVGSPVRTVIESLSGEVQRKSTFWPNPSGDDRKRFIGSISDGNFRVVRNIYYLNSFLPSIQGGIFESKAGSVVSFTMTGNLAVVIAFMLVAAFGGFFLTTLFMQSAFVITAATVGGLLIGYCVYSFGLMIQQAIDKRVLTDIFLKKS